MQKKWVIVAIAATILLLIVAVSWFALSGQKNVSNPARETALPLETALINSGAVKKCTTSSPVRGDNIRPWYSATFEVPQNREKTIAMVQSAASTSGYGLAHATAQNPGPVNASDVDNWYYDVTSRDSGYKELQSGKVQVYFTVKSEPVMLGSIGCGTDKDVKVNADANTTAVSLYVQLPEAKL